MEALEVIGNDLLRWMSARGSGSWAQFRAAVERLRPNSSPADESGESDDVDASKLSLHQTLRLNFERLGFAEFFGAAGEEDWRVAPPVLVIGTFGARRAGLLTGARSDTLLRRIEAVTIPHEAHVEIQENCPDSILLETDNTSLLTQIARSASLVSQLDGPIAILSTLRALSTDSLTSPVDAPIGREWGFELFRERELRWKAASRAEMERSSHGLFRLRFRYRTEFLLRWANRSFPIVPQEAKFLLLKRIRKHVLVYDPRTTTLVIPAICRPPILIDRALVLCSGRLPTFEIHEGLPSLLYQSISQAAATITASLLRQRLQ